MLSMRRRWRGNGMPNVGLYFVTVSINQATWCFVCVEWPYSNYIVLMTTSMEFEQADIKVFSLTTFRQMLRPKFEGQPRRRWGWAELAYGGARKTLALVVFYLGAFGLR